MSNRFISVGDFMKQMHFEDFSFIKYTLYTLSLSFPFSCLRQKTNSSVKWNQWMFVQFRINWYIKAIRKRISTLKNSYLKLHTSNDIFYIKILPGIVINIKSNGANLFQKVMFKRSFPKHYLDTNIVSKGTVINSN